MLLLFFILFNPWVERFWGLPLALIRKAKHGLEGTNDMIVVE